MLFLIGFAILIYSIILHEIAHGFMADRLGDPTAKLSGRLTLNPIPHIDVVMSIILPLILYITTHGQFVFGAAKPVPIDPFNLREGRKDMGLVGLAGPGMNLVLALLATLLFKIIFLLPLTELSVFFLSILELTVRINLILAALNLIPIPPLDGSRILAAIVPKGVAGILDSLEPFGLFILFFLLFFPIGGFSLGTVIFGLVSLWMRFLGF